MKVRTIWVHVLVLVLLGSGCRIKQKKKVDVPTAYSQAKSASLDELIDLINRRYAAVTVLSVSRFEVQFRAGSIEEGIVEEYRRTSGYFVAQSPDSIYLNISNPLTHSTIVSMATAGGTFKIWVPRDNKFLIGSMDVKLKEENPIYNVQPYHLIPAVLVESLPVADNRYRYFLEEDQDAAGKYYVVGILQESLDPAVACLVRKIWVERSRMRLERQCYYDCGRRTALIRYRKPVEMDCGLLVNTSIEVERIPEKYTLRLELARVGVKVNFPLKPGTFTLTKPPGAELVKVTDESGE